MFRRLRASEPAERRGAIVAEELHDRAAGRAVRGVEISEDDRFLLDAWRRVLDREEPDYKT